MPPFAIKRSLVWMIPSIANTSIGNLRAIAATVGVEPRRLMSTSWASDVSAAAAGRKLNPFDLGAEALFEHVGGLADRPNPRPAEPAEANHIGVSRERG